MATPTEFRASMRRLDSVFSALQIAFVGLFVAFVTWLALRHHFTVFNYDEWRMIAWLQTTPFGEWLVTPHNSHVIPLTLLVYAADFSLGARGLLLVGVSLLCTALAALVLCRIFAAEGEPSTPLARSTASFLVFAVFWGAVVHSLLWGAALWNTSTLLWFTLAVACGITFVQHRTRSGAPLRWLVFAGVFAGMATFSFGTGFATWGSLLAIALVARLPLRQTASLAAGAASSVAVYLVVAGSHARPRPRAVPLEPGTLGLPALAEILRFDASFVGGALARTVQGLFGWDDERALAFAATAGAVGLVALVVFALFLWLRPARATPRALLALGLAVFPAGAGLAAGLARVGMGADQSIMPRYAIWSVLFWVGAVCAAVSLVPGSRARSGSVRALVLLPILASVCMLPAFADAMRAQQSRDRLLSMGSLALLLDVRSESLARRLSGGSVELVLDSMEALADQRRGFFDDPRADWPGRSLGSLGAVAEPSRCSGGIDRVSRLENRSGPTFRVRGWAWDHAASAPPSSIVIADPTGRVRGLGNRNPDWWDAIAGGPDSDLSPRSHWTGIVPRYDPGASHVAYAVLADGHLCRLTAFEGPR